MAIYAKKDANAVIFRLEADYTQPNADAVEFDITEPTDESKVIRFAMHWEEQSTKGDKNVFSFAWQENSTKIEKNSFDFRWVEALSTRESTTFDFKWLEKERRYSPRFKQPLGAKKRLFFPQLVGARKELKFIQPITFSTKRQFLALQNVGARTCKVLRFTQNCAATRMHQRRFFTVQNVGVQGQFLAVQNVGARTRKVLRFTQNCAATRMHQRRFFTVQNVGVQGQFLAVQNVGTRTRKVLHFAQNVAATRMHQRRFFTVQNVGVQGQFLAVQHVGTRSRKELRFNQFCEAYKRQKRQFLALQYCEALARKELRFNQFCEASNKTPYRFLAVQNVAVERLKTVGHKRSFMLSDHKILVIDYSVSIGINEKSAALKIARDCYFKIKLGDIIDININGIAFSLQIKSKDKSLSNSSTQYNIKLGKIDDKEIIIYSLEVNKKLSEIVQELYTDKGIIIQCNDILINKNTFMVTGTRGECLTSLLEPLLMYADVQQDNIIIYSQYPAAIGGAEKYGFNEFKAYSKTIHSTQYYSEIDVYSTEERTTPYTLIQEKQDDGSVIIKTPVVSEKEASVLALVHTGTNATTIKRIGFQVENKTETLEFIRGKAQTQHKIKSISSYSWRHNDLGNLTYKDKEITAEKDDIFGASILNVTYEAAFLVFRVFNSNYTTTQFLLIDKE